MTSDPALAEKHAWRATFGAPATRSPVATAILGLLALAMVAVHVFQLFTFTLPSGQFRNLHLAFSVAIGFLALIETLQPSRRLVAALGWLAVALTAAVAVYIHLEYRALTEVRSFLPNEADIVVGLCSWRLP